MKRPRSRPSRARSRAKPAPARDTDESTFCAILHRLVSRVPGARAAVLVDADGEAVDYYSGRLQPFALKLAGAHWQIVLRHVSEPGGAGALGATRSLLVRAASSTFVVHALPDGYVLVVLLGRRAGFSDRTRAFDVCERALAHEAGWRLRGRQSWVALDVVTTRAGRPTRVRESSCDYALEVLGRVANLRGREQGWRVRIDHGAELTLVREPGGHWYADESPDAMHEGPAERRAKSPA